jgi:anti-sigma B factor antagonist
LEGWIEISEVGTTLVLRIGGELDMATRNRIEPAVLASIETAGAVTIDLAELSFCDSSGLALLVEADSRATARGVTFSIKNVPPAIRRLLHITGLDRKITVG